MTLALRSASALIRPDANPYRPDPKLDAYHREMLAPFGVEVDLERLARSPNVGFPELAERVLRGLPDPISAPDLLILTYGLPDMFPLKSTTTHLNYLVGGGRSFAIAEQGLRAPFTALRVADAYARSGRCTSLALFVCEQTTLPYRDPLVDDTPLVDSAVVLYFDDGDGFAFQETRVGESGDLLADYLRDADLDRTLVVAGPWVAAEELAGVAAPVHRVAPGTYCTSVWLDLARHHRAWAADYDTVLLCDTDPRTGRSQAALLRLRPARIPLARTAMAIESSPLEAATP
jgi:hypothetical protein